MKSMINNYKPAKMWIDGKCFELRKFQKKPKKPTLQSTDGERSEEAECSIYVEENSETNYDITTNDEGKLATSFHLPHVYYHKLARFPHFCVKTLSNSTKTNISIPVNGKPEKLVITGENKESITKARSDIHSVIGLIREQCMAMQFISIPTLSEEITANFEKFKEEILNGDKIPGMEESIFQSPHKLHLTVVVFALLGENEKAEAANALQEYKTTVLDPMLERTGPIKISISGISCMNDNLKKVDVLYANAKIIEETEEHNLQKIVNDMSDYFYERGLLRKYQDNVKLHMTLMNTKYRKSIASPKKKRWTKRQSFDATTIIEKYKDYKFGECNLDSIHLSLMSSIGDDGFYKSLSTIKLVQ